MKCVLNIHMKYKMPMKWLYELVRRYSNYLLFEYNYLSICGIYTIYGNNN